MTDWIHDVADVVIFGLIATIAIVVLGLTLSMIYETGHKEEKEEEKVDSVTLEKRKINQEILRCIEVTQKPEECKNALTR